MIKINTKQHVKITARSAAVAAVRRLKPGLINDELYLDLQCVCMVGVTYTFSNVSYDVHK